MRRNPVTNEQLRAWAHQSTAHDGLVDESELKPW
jgi:hypothetical protein